MKKIIFLIVIMIVFAGCFSSKKGDDKPKAPLSATTVTANINGWLGYKITVQNTSSDKTITNMTITVTDYAKYQINEDGSKKYLEPNSASKPFSVTLPPGQTQVFQVEKTPVNFSKTDVSFSSVLASDRTAW